MFPSSKYKKILGLNRRNQEYIRPYNPPSAKNIADNKILTKKVLAKESIKTPQVYKIIKNKKQLAFLDWDSLPRSFVIKPNKGTGGNGIIVLFGKKKGETAWIRPSGEIMSKRDIILHIENILEGRFSMGSKTDVAISGRKVVNINEKIYLSHSDSKDPKKAKREAFTAFMDTGVLTSRVSKNVASRLGFLPTVKFFDSLDIPKKFNSLKEAQEYIDENMEKLTEDEEIVRIAKTVEENGIVIRPVVLITAKISGDTKDIEMIITDNMPYPVALGRADLKGYLIDTSKTFK